MSWKNYCPRISRNYPKPFLRQGQDLIEHGVPVFRMKAEIKKGGNVSPNSYIRCMGFNSSNDKSQGYYLDV